MSQQSYIPFPSPPQPYADAGRELADRFVKSLRVLEARLIRLERDYTSIQHDLAAAYAYQNARQGGAARPPPPPMRWPEMERNMKEMFRQMHDDTAGIARALSKMGPEGDVARPWLRA